ncbi:MAG: SPFH domain-containing protein [Phycisphaerales bacterium]
MADTPHNDNEHPWQDAEPQQPGEQSAELPGADERAQGDELITGRAASVRFSRQREVGTASNKARMDAANQSLADALRITYGFLQLGMVVLVILFVFSGFQKINEGERGISVFLGKPARPNIEPGAHLTWPYPIGEMIRVGSGAIEVPVARIFMPNRSGTISDDALLEADINQFNNQGRLNPARDGSLVTADLNIAHTQWTVNYHRSDHLNYVENILPEDEREIIVLAVRRGVVHTIAETTIDDLLKTSAETISARVREIAQSSLDALESGITIDRVVLVRKTPPLYLLDRFASVQSAAQNAGKAREDAMLLRDQQLNEIAGRAAPILIEMIDEYERLVELSETEQASALLSEIDTVLAGGEVNYNGQSTLAMVSGEVSEILNNARSRASSRISRAIADLNQFRAKQAQYEANPQLMISRDWSSAMAQFLNRDFVSTMYLPEGIHAELLINPDPDIERERDRMRREREAMDAMQRRRQEFRDDLYRSRRGLQPLEEP